MNKNVIRFAKILEIDVNQAEKLFDFMNLTDLAAVTVALNNNDETTIKDIYNKYKNQLLNMPDTEEIKEYYNTQLENFDSAEALTATADYFGIKEEDVTNAINHVLEPTVESIYIPDAQVKAVYERYKQVLEGKATKLNIMEVKNTWQRQMFYGLIPKVTADMIQKIIDLTPLKAAEEFNKTHGLGVGNPLEENKLGYNETLELLIAYKLQNINEDFSVDDIDITNDENDIDDVEEDMLVEPEDKKVKKLIDSIVSRKF